jgi:hypothetical protein
MSKEYIIRPNEYLEYKYELPSLPKEQDIIGFDIKKKSEQYWNRTIIPRRFLSDRDRDEFIERERLRCEYGAWFMNNGEPTYITGYHYEHLTYMKFPQVPLGYCEFRQCQKDDFYFIDYVEKDPNSYGGCIIKPRRYGASDIFTTVAIRNAEKTENRHVGIIHMSKKDAVKKFFIPLVDVFLNRPEWLRAKIYLPQNRKPKTELLFSPAEVQNSELGSANGDFLNSWIRPGITDVKAFDGEAMHCIIVDEAFKMNEADISELVDNHKPTTKTGQTRLGKIWCLSTMGDADNLMDAADRAIKLYNDSDPRFRNDNGETKSGLYKYFISSLNGYQGTIDKYGVGDMELANELIENEAKEKDPKKRMYFKRKFPRTEKEAIQAIGGTKVFGGERAASRLDVLNSLPKHEKPYVVGRLEYIVDDSKTPKVKFIEDDNGYIKLAIPPDISRQNRYKTIARPYTDEYGYTYNYEPYQDCEFVLGCDPFRYKKRQTSSGKESNGVVYVWKKYDYTNPTEKSIKNKWALQYIRRTDDPKEMYKDCVKIAIFFGCPSMVESQVEGCIDMFCEMGFGKFVMKDPYRKDKLGCWTSSRTTNDGVSILTSLMSPPMQNSDEDDYLMQFPFEEQIIDLLDFDPRNTTEHDETMATIMAMFGAKELRETIISSGIDQNRQSIINAFYGLTK